MNKPTDEDFHMTYQQIGDVMGISRQRVRQIEEAALKKLRKRMASQRQDFELALWEDRP
jgi:DNA-directed RNA polymerase sigma subunit (sigma70/sigma32)